MTDNPTVKRGNTGGKKELYIPEGINWEMPIFVTEGIIDCLSFVKLGVPAMAVDGAGNFKNLAEWLNSKGFKNAEVKTRLILVGDNNDDGTGQKQAEAGVKELVKGGYAAVSVILSEDLKYDANEFLQKDFEGFVGRVNEIYGEVENELEKISAEISAQKLLEETGGFISAESYDKIFFEKELAELKKVACRKSGYENLDEKQEFLPGLYVIGAISSLGKTSFCLQWAEQMARQGETVLFCSYEMSLIELHSKMLARNLYLKNQHTTLTATQIRRGGGSAELKSVRGSLNLSNYLSNLKIAKCKFETIDELLEKLEVAMKGLERPPVIFIDYLQFIRPSTKLRETSARAAIDDIVMKLKIFQQEKNALIVVVSSFNRMNYTQTAAFESFKESGGVEYTADVLLALELYCTAELKGSQSDRKTIDDAKKEYPRKVRLKCLKNRVGGLYECFFKFYMKNDYFEACKEEDFKVQSRNAHRS